MFKRDMRLFPYTLNSAFFALCFLRYIVIGKGEFIMWVLYAVGSAFFSGITAILAKCGIRKTDSTVATAVRTVVVLVFSWLMVFVTGKKSKVREIPKKELLFICLSGFATGGAWLCYYKALQDGLASVVVPIDKLSILVTIAFSYIVFKRNFQKNPPQGLFSLPQARSRWRFLCFFSRKFLKLCDLYAFRFIS